MLKRFTSASSQEITKIDQPLPEIKSTASSSSILATLTTRDSEVKTSVYVSPYDHVCPLNYIILHNRSKNAANFAIRKLKDAWPSLQIIQVVQEGRDPLPLVDEMVEIKDWNSMDHFKTQFDKLVAKNPHLRKSMTQGKVGFYSVWSAQAEDPLWANRAKAAGFKWIGASPDTMKGLEKINYKKFCQSLELPTADFIEILPPLDVSDKEEALKVMAQNMMTLYKNSELGGKAVFVKHNKGGGGRGSKKVAEMTDENALGALRKIINETGGDFNGVYIELALDLEEAQLFQIELECDACTTAPGGRLVWFNQENQKVLEVGFTDQAILELIPKEIYETCRTVSQKIFKASGYDNRGTNEILIVKNKEEKWSIYLLEFNKRIQVENEALAELVVDARGRTRNVPAEQIMRAFGFPPPKNSDFQFKGPGIIAHKRLLSCEITETGSVYCSGLDIHGAIYPQGADVQFARGPVYLDADPQIGRELITANSWTEMCSKLLIASREFQFYGPRTELSTYDDFFRKLASDPLFQAGHLGCNRTFDVLRNSPVETGLPQKIVYALATTVTPLITHGYRPNEGVKDQPFPTRSQIKEFTDFMEKLTFQTPPETPFSRFLKHQDFKKYIQELKNVLNQHGGGTVTVFPRDVMQSMGDQESALLQTAAALIAEIYFAGTGIGIGYETGGAQFQAALMRKFDWMAVLLSGCLSNLPSHSLTRSKWMNGLTAKTPPEQAFVFKTIAAEIAKLYGWTSTTMPYLPWMPYNFHAGNDPEQDVTTREMLKANLVAIPCWAWDPRYTEEQFTNWVKRQITLFKEEGKPFYLIRIKNAGEGPHWNADEIVNRVQIIRQQFNKNGLEEPIIYIHNHEFSGSAASIGAKAIRKCQKQGYRFLVVDSAPPGLSHNSNLVISKAFVLSACEKTQLDHYNQGAQLLLNLASRFNNQNLMRTQSVQDPYSEMAGGTGSSDLADAIKMGIPPSEISKLQALARELTGLGTAVTPYSEWIKQIGFAIWNNKDIQPKTVEAAKTYIEKGGQLTIAEPILQGLREWKTLLPRPPVIIKLLNNHGISAESKEEKVPTKPLDLEKKRRELQAELPRTLVTARVLATVFAFDKIGKEFLTQRDRLRPESERTSPQDLTPLMSDPAFVYSEVKHASSRFTLYGRKVTLEKTARNSLGQIEVDYRFQGHCIRTIGVDPSKPVSEAPSVVQLAKDKDREIGAVMAGALVKYFVKPGNFVKAGQPLAIIEAMKMEHVLRADKDLMVESVRPFDEKNRMVEKGEILLTFSLPQKEVRPTVTSLKNN